MNVNVPACEIKKQNRYEKTGSRRQSNRKWATQKRGGCLKRDWGNDVTSCGTYSVCMYL